ncbi:hypothetical protein [Nocardia sp. IFM 10818]
MRTAVALSITAVAAVVAAGCSSSQEATTAERTSPASATSAAAPAQDAGCYPARAIDDPELAAFAAGLELPTGVQVITGRVSKQSNKPDQVGVALDLCIPDSNSADALRPIATSIAAALKPTSLGQRTFALYVADMSADYSTEAKLKDPNYDLHLWNGKPSTDAENAHWEVVGS